METLKIIYLALLLVAFPAAFYLTGKAIYNMFRVVTNVNGRYASLLGPILLLMPSMFNEIGNIYRVKLLRQLPWLFASYLVCFGVVALAGLNNAPH